MVSSGGLGRGQKRFSRAWVIGSNVNAGSQKYTLKKSTPLAHKTIGNIHLLTLNHPKKLQIHLENTEKSFGGFGRRALAASQTLLLARSALVRADFKFSEAPKALRAHFFVRLDRFCAQTCSSEPPRDAPSLDFQGQDGRFFKIFACDERLTRKTSGIKHCKNQYETHFGASAHEPKIDQNSIRKRF